MSQTPNTSPSVLREAFYMLATAQDIPDAKLLDDVVRQYPEFAEELTEFAVTLAVEALRGDHVVDAPEMATDPTVTSQAVSRAMSHFQNRLYAVTTAPPQEERAKLEVPETPNPFGDIPRTEFRDLARRLNANVVFVAKLRDRQVDPDTMTLSFQKRVADELKAPLDVLVAHFSAHQPAPAMQFFKADTKPSTGAQQSFKEAVRSSGLTEAQQRFLLEL